MKLIFNLYLLVLIVNNFNIPANSYDSSTMQYNPSGRILQVDYALETVNKGNPVIGLKCEDGVILCIAKENKKHSSRLEKSNTKKTFFIGNNLCAAGTGLLFDSIAVIEAAKKISLQYRSKYGEDIPIDTISDELSSLFHKQTISASSRPLGLGLTIVGYDYIRGYQVFTIEPDGSCSSWIGSSLGKQSKQIKIDLADILNTSKQNTMVNRGINLKIDSFSSISRTLKQLDEKIIQKLFNKKNKSVKESTDTSDSSLEGTIKDLTDSSEVLDQQKKIDSNYDLESEDDDESDSISWDIEVMYLHNVKFF